MCFALTAAEARAAAAARCKSASLNSLRFSSVSLSLPLTAVTMPFSVAEPSRPLLSTLFGFAAFSTLLASLDGAAAGTMAGTTAPTLFSVGGEEEEDSFGLFSSVAGLSSSLSLSFVCGFL